MTTANPADLPAVLLSGIGKRYALYERPIDRLKQLVWGSRRQYFREFHALSDISLSVRRGEVLGIVGRNGAGKSTLLQIVCGTLSPSAGQVQVNGRIAALLELGAGFNPEFSGRENVFLAAALLGLTTEETRARFDDIVEFSGIGQFIDQPVKTYSSGMFVRLAFSVATSVDPDILIIDEALSVGDGDFSRKSFDRIMAMKHAGKTILFCSHSMYQIEVLCTQAIWLDGGICRVAGPPAEVVSAYQQAIEADTPGAGLRELGKGHREGDHAPGPSETPVVVPGSIPRLLGVEVRVDGAIGGEALSGTSCVEVRIRVSALEPARVSIAVAFVAPGGRWISSAGTQNDGIAFNDIAPGTIEIALIVEKLALLKGDYGVEVGLLCERAIHVYEWVSNVATLRVNQSDLTQGVVRLEHRWQTVR